jgi:hypothetical protein
MIKKSIFVISAFFFFNFGICAMKLFTGGQTLDKIKLSSGKALS